MQSWSANPRIYEINTAVWLTTLNVEHDQTISLSNIPDEVVDELVSYHIDAVWLMGIWHRGPATRASALNYVHEYRGALPDLTPEDVIGSAYAIHNYEVDPLFGGRKGLATFRKQLQRRGLKLILDFVPNHVGVDHPMLPRYPEHFILGTPDLLHHDPTNFFGAKTDQGQDVVVAHGRDPYFPGWVDTAQLNVFHPGCRDWVLYTLKEIAKQCDGVRCDMAMLAMNQVFMRTWGWLGLQAPEEDFWLAIIPKIKAEHPDFLFMAEAYWNTEYALQQQGFDFTYDKVMYDRLVKGDVNGILLHMSAHIDFLKRNIRFIENHDERRAAIAIGIDRSRPSAALICTMPGAVLLHDGQFTGRRIKLPVQLQRQPIEEEHPALKKFYITLLQETRQEIYTNGEWSLFRCYAACDGCEGAYNIIAQGWRKDDEYRLIVVNMSDQWSQGLIDLQPWRSSLAERGWLFYDMMHRHYTEEDGSTLAQEGLRIDLEAHQTQIFHILPIEERIARKIKARA